MLTRRAAREPSQQRAQPIRIVRLLHEHRIWHAVRQIVVPVAYPAPIVPRCMPSVETVIVPAELGGERKIRITRCPW